VRITEQEVLHVAHLARLSIGGEEAARFRRELGSILEYMDMLSEVDTSGVEPFVCVHEQASATRDDEPAETLPLRLVLAQSPAAGHGAFEVPLVIEEG